MDIDYFIIQAGGKGSRLGYLTDNKPKALVPVENLPMIFHLFKKFPDKKYVIIADYKKDVLREYLESFADVKYQVVDAAATGTCSGVKLAINLLPENVPFMLIWSDLILSENFAFPIENANYIGISKTFSCRWKYNNGVFLEETSMEHGVAGLFIFENKSYLSGVPQSGELVRWIQKQEMSFEEVDISGTREFGLLSDYENLFQEKCRPFNKITIDGNIFIKEPIDEQGEQLSYFEQKWYEMAGKMNVKNIPEIYGTNPLRMERIYGKNIYEYTDFSIAEKKTILEKIITYLKSLHSLVKVNADTFSMKEAYYSKTIDRLQKIRYLVPYADQKEIIINGKRCPNVYYYKRDFERKLEKLPCNHFSFIHGDCTFSNIIMKNDIDPIFIDPRGYFGHSHIFGDANYDWAKLYYSVFGNYDRFNLRDFCLLIENETVDLKINSNCWEALESDFFALSDTDPQVIKLIHAVIWLSLTTYTWQDYDSICGAFYNGLFYLEEVL